MYTSLLARKGNNLGATPAPGQKPSAPAGPKSPMGSRWNPDGTPMGGIADVAAACMQAPKYDDPIRKQPVCNPRTPGKTERLQPAKTPDGFPMEPRWKPDGVKNKLHICKKK